MTQKTAPDAGSETYIADARGRKVTQLDPFALHLLHRHDLIEAAPLKRIAAEVGSGLSKTGRRLLWFMATMALLTTIVRVIEVIDRLGVSGLWTFETLFISQIWFAGLITLGVLRRQRFGRVRRIMLVHRRCPHCGYDLTGLPRDAADASTVCPECGCAWTLKEGEAPHGE
jgi:hypothetical protein